MEYPGIKPLMLGHVLLIICCVFYLIWWCVAFRPGYQGSRASGMLLLAVISGLGGVIYSVMGIISKSGRPVRIPVFLIILGAVVIYVLLMVGSSLLLHRQVTTELFLIIGWLMLEIISYQSAYRMEIFGTTGMNIFIAVAAIVAVLSLYFYMQYYNVSEIRGYIYGMIPLITVALCMTGFIAVCWRQTL